ncbi:diacylglycerol kinase [Leucobacter insecticola]|uniref:Diacylglycerol kinase n=1 Tax=Leucobacter insecticola TaxID=2714934 RepID=A0A6G8FHG9_9MICO|nr:diacylglycerol kinase family protein [Leucobacter insecticola]QIM15804.1 diacylglycerol kinase [Leucobacter insecticola]
MGTSFGIVWNPTKVDSGVLQDALDAALQATLGAEDPAPDAHWFETTPDDPGQEATARALAAGCSLIIAVGGDGTVRAVAEQLGESSKPGEPAGSGAELGIVPLGTGNLLARNLQIPLGNPQAAFERALTREAAPLDLGTVEVTRADGSRTRADFVVMLGFGIDAQMIVETNDELKAKAGWLAYVESLGRAAASTDVVDFSLFIDGGEAMPERAHTLLIANCGTLPGGFSLLPDAVPDDGELDLLVLRADGLAAWLDTMRNMVWDNGVKRIIRQMASDTPSAESSNSASHLRARSVRVELPMPLMLEIDGEELGEATAFEVSVDTVLRVR